MENANLAVVVEGLRKRYPQAEALKGIDLNLFAGKIWGLLGPNGSGKSTFLKCLMGLVQKDVGTIRIFAKPLSRQTRGQIAFVPEIDNLYPWMTVQGMLDFTAAFYRDWEESRALELLEFMRLDPTQKISSLSKGMRARLKLILSLAREAPLILLDEPFSGIDPASRDRVLEGIVRQFKSETQTMIVSTHAVGETERLFDSVIFLEEGRVRLQGSAEDLRTEYGKSINDLFKEVFA